MQNRKKLSFYNCLCLLQDCVEAGMIQKDPNNKDCVLVYRAASERFEEGWYSTYLFSAAHELADSEEDQISLMEDYQKKTGKEFARRAI